MSINKFYINYSKMGSGLCTPKAKRLSKRILPSSTDALPANQVLTAPEQA